MKLFNCDQCGQLIYFENVLCTRCQSTLGFLPQTLQLAALTPTDEGLWQSQADDSGQLWRQCQNYHQHQVCNWMVPADSASEFCPACRLNRTIPDLSLDTNQEHWHTLEIEKRRLIYSLLQLQLPLQPLADDAQGLAFDFLADAPCFNERERVMTGHLRGVITINLAEADPVVREQLRHDMAEPYRTVLGHFRHESGHYYWERLIANSDRLHDWRNLFGDETQDYNQALATHYAQGPAANWSEQFISAYAASHPWEDWAETWAHYLHIIDTLDTAHQFGLRTRPQVQHTDSHRLEDTLDPYQADQFEPLFEDWLALTFALNSLNRSMGHEHSYPFVLTEAVKQKLAFVHQLIHEPHMK